MSSSTRLVHKGFQYFVTGNVPSYHGKARYIYISSCVKINIFTYYIDVKDICFNEICIYILSSSPSQQ